MRHPCVLTLLAVLLCGGCTNNLVFVEESHLAFKAQFRTQSAAPFNLDLGYRRGMIALIPLQSDENQDEGEAEASEADESSTPAPANVPGEPNTKVIRIQHDPDELMSLYSTFRANIGFNDPVEVCHFVATGVAATALLSDKEALKALAEVVGMCEESEGGEQ
jgi:hypothetical protein